jgi:hypothetical protein
MKLKKADEMEMSINFKSMRLSWAFLIITLSVWEIIELIRGNSDSPVILLVSLQGVIFWGSKIFYTKRMTKDSDYNEK